MSESPTHPDAPRADEARDDECGLLHPNGVFCDRPMGHVGSHAAYSDSPELCLSWGTLSVDAPRAGGETPETRVDNLLRAFQNACERAHDEVNPYWRNAAEKERAILRNELRASLLERHRDGERWHATEDDLPMMLNLADECEVWGNTAWATRLREIALNGESFESFQSRRGPSPERASK